jgi:tRNA-modifying protein YgfZ
MTDSATILNNITPDSIYHQLATDACVMIDLSHLGLIQVSGADALTFLQGQVTNDVNLLNMQSHYTGYCTAKGRLLALFLAYRVEDSLYLQLPKSILPSIAKRLQMYVLRSKVTIADVSEQFFRLGFAGKNAAQVLAHISPRIPQTEGEVVQFDDGIIIKHAGAIPRFEIMMPNTNADKVLATLSQYAQVASLNLWHLLEIEAGIAEITEATQEKFVPQMVNLDALGGINFKKGCYTGQEIVARTHYLGKVKRRTLLAHIDSAQAPQVGDQLMIAQEAVGTVVRVASHPNGGFELLAEMHLESQENGTTMWNGNVLAFRPLPYAI